MYTDEEQLEITALRERVTRLCAAMQHINASLDPDTVLREIPRSARALTGAAHGVIVTVDDAGEAGDFTSSGITEEERRRLFGVARRTETVRALPRPARAAAAPGRARLRARARVHSLNSGQDLPRHPDAHRGARRWPAATQVRPPGATKTVALAGTVFCPRPSPTVSSHPRARHPVGLAASASRPTGC